MNYVIFSDDPAFILRHARVAGDALIIAQDLAGGGRPDVRISTPEGETLPLRQFAIRVREEAGAG